MMSDVVEREVGDTIVLRNKYGTDNLLMDSVYVLIKSPSGIETEHSYSSSPESSILLDQNGYYIKVFLDEWGTWYYRWYSKKGTDTVVDEGYISVKKSPFTNPIPPIP